MFIIIFVLIIGISLLFIMCALKLSSEADRNSEELIYNSSETDIIITK